MNQEQKEEIYREYSADNMKKLRKLIGYQTTRFGKGCGYKWVDKDYDEFLSMAMVIDEDNNDWSYQVVDKDNNIYAQYYDREYGINEVVEKIDKVINEVINEMVKEKILEVKKYGKYKNNRKSKHDKHSKKSGKISQSK